MKIVKKNGAVSPETNLEFEAKDIQEPATFHVTNSTPMHNKKESKEKKIRLNGSLSHAARRAKPLINQEFDAELPAEEMHWMAFAAYNQK